MNVLGAIELGGTKTVCGVVTRDAELLARERFATTTPVETCKRAIEYLTAAAARYGELCGVGVGSFGPLVLDLASDRHGQILATPKTAWAQANVLETLARFTGLPSAIDTDVNCALRAEAGLGAGVGHENLAYITVGTGIGAGLMLAGQVATGQAHPEVGHLLIPQFADDREFQGACVFHGACCVEGLAAGPAIEKRWGRPPIQLEPAHAAWDLEARYLAVLCINLVLVASPSRIVLGGGVMQQAQLYPLVRERFVEFLNDYLELSLLADSVDELIVPPALGGDAGVLGASMIARQFLG